MKGVGRAAGRPGQRGREGQEEVAAAAHALWLHLADVTHTQQPVPKVFYKKDKHNRLAPGAWDKISSNELIDIMQFMYDHAADSAQPETCGQ